MVAKSVIEIDVLDAKFKAFTAEFEKLQKAIKKLPVDWQNVNKESAKLGDEIERADKHQKAFNKSVRDSNRELSSAARTAAGIANSMASAAMSVAKWVAFGAIGGGFGLGGLASSASDYRRQAQGYGVTTGQLRAANTNFGRYISPEGALGNIANIQNDLSRRWMLTNLGVGVGQNPAEALPTAMRNATRMFKAGGGTQQYAEAMGLTQVFSLEELRRMASLSEKELNETIAKYKEDQEKLAVDDQDSRAWQDFWVQLRRSGQTLETSFLKALVDLTPELTALSAQVTKVITDFMSSDEMRKAVKSFTEYLASPDFKTKVGEFFEAVGSLANVAYRAAKFLGLIHEKGVVAQENEADEVSRRYRSGTVEITPGANKSVAEKRAALFKMLTAQGYNRNAAAGFVGGVLGENAALDPNAENQGHIGIGQWDARRQAEFARVMGRPLKGSSFEDQARFMLYELQHGEKAAGDALRNAVSVRGGAEVNMQYERPYNPGTQAYDAELNRRVGLGNGVSVLIQNDTGGSAVVSTSALPGAGPTR